MQQREQGRRRRLRFTPLAIGLGVLSSAVLGLGATGTFSAFTATVENSSNTATGATLVMQETDASGVTASGCTSTDNNGSVNGGNSSTCASFDKYGGVTLTPGTIAAGKTIRIYDTGTTDPATFTLQPGSCSASGGISGATGNICDYLTVTASCALSSAPTTWFSIYSAQTLSAIATAGSQDLKTLGCLPTKESSVYTTVKFTVGLSSGANNTVQGQTATQKLTWQFTG